eukprot:g79369.t1
MQISNEMMCDANTSFSQALNSLFSVLGSFMDCFSSRPCNQAGRYFPVYWFEPDGWPQTLTRTTESTFGSSPSTSTLVTFPKLNFFTFLFLYLLLTLFFLSPS